MTAIPHEVLSVLFAIDQHKGSAQTVVETSEFSLNYSRPSHRQSFRYIELQDVVKLPLWKTIVVPLLETRVVRLPSRKDFDPSSAVALFVPSWNGQGLEFLISGQSIKFLLSGHIIDTCFSWRRFIDVRILFRTLRGQEQQETVWFLDKAASHIRDQNQALRNLLQDLDKHQSHRFRLTGPSG